MNELKSKLLEVEHILKNDLTKKVILDFLKDYINYDDVQKSIESYLNNFEIMIDADNDQAYEASEGLLKHLNHFIQNTKDATKIRLYHMELLNDMNFIISNSFGGIDENIKIQEIADEAGASNAILIEKAKELGYAVKRSNDTVTLEQADILVDYVINGVKPKLPIKSNAKIVNNVPKNINLPQMVWVIAPGEDAEIWEECERNGYIHTSLHNFLKQKESIIPKKELWKNV